MASSFKHLKFYTLDVFTRTHYEGNPLAVVHIPTTLSTTISPQQKQKIAREFNLSETVFLHERAADSFINSASESGSLVWHIEIFTTTEEVPFAGHPTVGAAALLFERLERGVKKITFQTKAGPVQIEKDIRGVDGEELWSSASVPFNIRVHKKTFLTANKHILWPVTSGKVREVELRAPFVSVVKGMTFMLIQLDSLEELAEVEVSNEDLGFSALLDAEDDWNESFVARYYYVLLDTKNSQGVRNIRSRMLERGMEDPATGSAACSLASYLALRHNGTHFSIVQGVEMGRTSVIEVEVELSDNQRNANTLKLSGTAVLIMDGMLIYQCLKN